MYFFYKKNSPTLSPEVNPITFIFTAALRLIYLLARFVWMNSSYNYPEITSRWFTKPSIKGPFVPPSVPLVVLFAEEVSACALLTSHHSGVNMLSLKTSKPSASEHGDQYVNRLPTFPPRRLRPGEAISFRNKTHMRRGGSAGDYPAPRPGVWLSCAQPDRRLFTGRIGPAGPRGADAQAPRRGVEKVGVGGGGLLRMEIIGVAMRLVSL